MIKCLVMDVDGTLTDGKIYIGPDGEAMKSFNIKDGYGINDILPRFGIVPIIITGRKSRIVERRCAELHIVHLYQGVHSKREKLFEVLALLSQESGEVFALEHVAYCGDDCNDLDCMLAIKEAGGIVGCPADAVEEVRRISNFCSRFNGGCGAVREFVEVIAAMWNEQPAL